MASSYGDPEEHMSTSKEITIENGDVDKNGLFYLHEDCVTANVINKFVFNSTSVNLKMDLIGCNYDDAIYNEEKVADAESSMDCVLAPEPVDEGGGDIEQKYYPQAKNTCLEMCQENLPTDRLLYSFGVSRVDNTRWQCLCNNDNPFRLYFGGEPVAKDCRSVVFCDNLNRSAHEMFESNEPLQEFLKSRNLASNEEDVDDATLAFLHAVLEESFTKSSLNDLLQKPSLSSTDVFNHGYGYWLNGTWKVFSTVQQPPTASEIYNLYRYNCSYNHHYITVTKFSTYF